ncbi:MAG: tetratricopeptide repeat protein [Pyrinomonadaceae bacterium]
MKNYRNWPVVFISHFLILLLLTQTFGQMAFSGNRSVSHQSRSVKEAVSLNIPVPQQEVIDAATKNFLNGLSGTRFEVAMSVIQTVKRAGGKVVAVGSWVSGKKYLDPLLGGTSDHDLRLVFEGSEPLAKAKYNQIRREIVRQINERFGAEAPKVLQSINLYPPEVLLEGLDDADDALRKLMQEGINPNLGEAVTEGLWGKGAKAFRDAYEAKAGRMIWKEGNLIRSGFADLLPAFGENAGIYTLQGAGNTSRQFADKVDDALKAGDAKGVQKSLERLRNTIRKGRDLGRFGKAGYLDDLLKELDDCCKNDLKKLAEAVDDPAFQRKLAKSLQRAKIEAELMLRYAAETNPQTIQIIREMMEAGGGRWARAREAFFKYGDEVLRLGGKVNWEKAFKGFFAVLAIYQVYDYYKKFSEADLQGILENALIDATFAISAKFIIGFVPIVLKAIMDDAIDFGYAVITNQQDCLDLIAGIYEVKGRESLDVNQRAERSIEQLATQYENDQKVEAVVALHARNAAMRNGKEDPKAEKILYDKCSKEIVDRWRLQRIEIISQAIEILKSVEKDFAAFELVGSIDPQEVWVFDGKKAKVKADAKLLGDDTQIRQKLQLFADKIKSLGGESKAVAVSVNKVYQWIPGVEDEDLSSPELPIFDAQRAKEEFTFEYPGKIPLKFEYSLDIKVQSTIDDIFSVADKGYLGGKLIKSVSFEVDVLSPEGTAEIIAPAEAAEGETVNLSAKLDENLKKLKGLRLVWQDLSGEALPKTGNSFSISSESGGARNVRLEIYAVINGENVKVAEAEKQISIKPKDEKNTEDKTAKAEPSPSVSPDKTETETSTPKQLMFGGTAFDIWEGSNDEKGFQMKRKPASSKGTGTCQWEANVSAEVWGKLRPSFAPDNPQELDKKMTEFAAESKRWGKTATAKGFSINDFKGKFSDTNVRFRGGSASPDAGYRGDSVSAEGRGWVIRDGRTIEVGYNVFGGGCWENSDRAFLESQAKAAQNEAQAIINSLTLTGDGAFAKNAYSGPKLDGSDMPKVSLSSDAPSRVKVGDVITVQVSVENVKPEDSPLEYNWSGEIKSTPEAAKTKASVIFQPAKPGKQRVSVSVDGSQYFLGSDSIEFDVGDFKAEIKQITPQTKVAVGVPVAFSAQLVSGGKPAAGNYIYRFQPSPEVKFETNESADKNTKAVFSKPGREKVWVQILEQKGDSLETVAESEQIEIEIVEPELKITFDQEKALVGKAVKAKVDVVPADLKDIDFRWEVSSNAKQTLESNDAKEITFIPQDNKPVTVKVFARVPVSGDGLGEQSATITARQFEVKVDVLGTLGPKPKVWKESVGLVPVDKGIAVFQNVGLKANITPAAEDLRYRWTINEDSHFVGGSSSSEVRVNRSRTGMCEASVVVTDKDGIELGRGSAAFNVSISQNELDTAEKAGESAEKVKEAEQLNRKGQIDEAISKAEEAAQLNPKNTGAKILSDKLKRDKQTIVTQMEKTRGLMAESKFPEAQAEFFKAKNLNSYYKPVQELEVELRDAWSKYDAAIRNSLGDIRVANETKDFKKALELAGSLRSEHKLTPSTERELSNYENWAKKHETEKERQREILKRGEEKFQDKDYEGAIKDFDVMTLNFNNYWNGNVDPEPRKYGRLKNEAAAYVKEITQNLSVAQKVIAYKGASPKLLEQAAENIEKALAISPNHPEALRLKALVQDRKTKAVSAGANQAISSGDSYHSRKIYDQAVKQYDQAIAIDPNNSEIFRKRGLSKQALSDSRGALRDYDRAIELDPRNHKAFADRGNLRGASGDLKQAHNDLDQSISLNPQYAPAYSYRGIVKILEKDYDGAVSDLNIYIRSNPRDGSAYFNRGLAKHYQKDLNGAIQDYTRAVTFNPQYSSAFRNRGAAKESLNDLSGAKTDLEKALQLDPNDDSAKKTLQRVLEKLNRAKTKPPVNTQPPVTTKTPVQTRPGEKAEVEIVNIENIGGVANKPTVPTRFTVRGSYMVTFIQTYHWNNGRGTSRPGTIGLRHSSGKLYGPWRASGQPGQGGVTNAYWQVRPNTVIPAGTYTVVDSDPVTWSQNTQSGGRGFATVKGYAVSGSSQAPAPAPSTTSAERMRISVTYINASKQTVHMFATGQTFAPDNRISPGGRRTASGEGPKFTRITVYAGANGKVIHQLSFNVAPDGKYTVTFGANNRLTVRQTGGDSAPAGPSINVSGNWKHSSSGTLTLRQTGNQVTGTYPGDNGRIVGTVSGNVVTGYWIENNSGVKCSTKRDGSYHWGRIRWEFSGDKFSGKWFYCEKTTDGTAWTGTRIQ